MTNVREGYKESGWEQPRRLSHIAMRAIKPARLAKFYQDVFGLEKVSKLSDSENFYLTDGVAYLAIMPCDNDSYRGMKEGLHHLGFKVESFESAKKDLDQIGSHSPAAAPRKIDVGRDGPIRLKISKPVVSASTKRPIRTVYFWILPKNNRYRRSISSR